MHDRRRPGRRRGGRRSCCSRGRPPTPRATRSSACAWHPPRRCPGDVRRWRRRCRVSPPPFGAGVPDVAASAARLASSGHSRTLIDWLAVASRVPSSAHRWARPWPKPLARACMWMSHRTHSVGTSWPPGWCCRGSGPWCAPRAAGRRRPRRSRRSPPGWPPRARGARAAAPRRRSGASPGTPVELARTSGPGPRGARRGRGPSRRTAAGTPERGTRRVPGTAGGSTQVPDESRSPRPRAALTVRTSWSPSRPMARAWVVLLPDGGQDDLPVERRCRWARRSGTGPWPTPSAVPTPPRGRRCPPPARSRRRGNGPGCTPPA